MSRAIQEEHHVFHNKNRGFIRSMIATKCESFVDVYGRVHPNLVQEFYSNVRFDGTHISFSMFGTDYQWSMDQFARILRISNSGEFSRNVAETNLWNITEISTADHIVSIIARGRVSMNRSRPLYLMVGHLKNSCRSFLEVIRKNITFSERTGDVISVAEAVLLFAMEVEIPINTARILAMRMGRVRMSPEHPFIYPTLLNRLFYEIGVLGRREGSYDITSEPIVIPKYFDPRERFIRRRWE